MRHGARGIGALPLLFVIALGACSTDQPPTKPQQATPEPEKVDVYEAALLSGKGLTIASGVVSAALTNFPVLVRITDTDLQAKARADGNDIRFYDPAGTTLLPFQIESYTSSTGALVAWVKLSSIPTTGVSFQMRYGDNNSTDLSNMDTTWEPGFGAVWHLQENPAAASSLQDSSGNGHTQVNYALTPSQDTASLIGNGVLLNQVEEYVGFGDIFGSGTVLSISAWWKAPATLAQVHPLIAKGADANNHFFLGPLAASGTGKFQARARNAAATGAESGAVLVASAWNHMAMVYDGGDAGGNAGKMKMYFNGALVASPTYTGTIPNSYATGSSDIRLGSTQWNTGWQTNGTVDEVHLSTVVRSAAWIKAEYDNQKSGSTFLTMTGAPTISDVTDQTISANGNTGALAITLTDTDTALTSLTMSGSSSNTTIVPNGNIVFGGSGANRTVTVTPAAGQIGSVTITLGASDGTSTALDTFVLTVTCVTDANCAGSEYCDASSQCTAKKSNGNACTGTNQCTSGNCVDAVCCNSACAGGTTDCQACSTAAGAASNGTCGTITSASNTTCRGSAGACDPAEVCTGLSTTCPVDAKSTAGTVCRTSVGLCDPVSEACDGSSAACPADSFASAGTSCRPSAGVCDPVSEVCTGSSSACPADTYSASTVTCRSAVAGGCDVAENCTGSSPTCPADAVVASGTTCRSAVAGGCDVAETCNGTNNTCPTDAFAPSTTLCRYQNGQCDSAEFCTGSSNACPGDAYAPLGTDCGYTGGPNTATIYSTGLPNGTNANVQDFATSPAGYTTTGSNPSAATLQSTLATGWGSDAYKFATTAPASASYDYWRWVAGNGTASGSSRALQTSDYIEYDVYVDSNIDGIGGIDLKTDHASAATTGCSGSCDYFRGWSSWTDQNSIGGHPSSDISSHAYKKWYHRRLAVPSGLSGNTITYVDAVDENNSSGSRNAYYDNLTITQVAGACDGSNVCKVKDADRCAVNSDCSSGVCTAQTLDANMTHRWTFAGSGATATDTIAGSTYNATITNSSQSSGTVALNGTYQSSNASAQYITLGADSITTVNASIEVWFVWTTSTNAWQRLFDFGSTSSDYLFFTPNNGSSVARLEYLHGSTKYGVNTAAILTTGVLTQVVATYDDSSNTMTLYVNGTSIGSTTIGGSKFNTLSDTNNWLGRSEFGTDYTLAGTIYDARVYNKSLSAADVLASYRRGTEYSVCITQLANGVACTTNNQCISTFCTDGVCCNSACGSSATGDCQACSTAAGAPSNGTCATVTNTSTVCRASQGTCDVAETCSGSSASCPNDTQ